MSTSKSIIKKVEDNTPLWKYLEKIRKLETREEIGNESAVIVMSILKSHAQELRPISSDKPVPELKCVWSLNLIIW